MSIKKYFRSLFIKSLKGDVPLTEFFEMGIDLYKKKIFNA